MPNFIKQNRTTVEPTPDAKKSQATKHAWGQNMTNFLSGIRKFHRSLEGRRQHRQLGRFLATRNLLPKLGDRKSMVSLDHESEAKMLVREAINDQFDIVDRKWSISESFVDKAPTPGSQRILARVEGPFFLVNGISENKRFYSRRLWENGLGKLKRVLESGGAIGTCGHDQELNEKALLEGRFTHLTTKVWIDDSDPNKPIGMGEAIILDTPAGRNIYALIEAGYKLPVSSRAFGSYKGKGIGGEDIIDEDSFEPHGWDFVLNPGVKTAYPTIKVQHRNESLESGDTRMEPIQRLTEERIALQSDLLESVKLNETLVKQVESTQKKLAQAGKLLEGYRKEAGSLEFIKKLNEGLMKFLMLEPLKSYAKESGIWKSYNDEESNLRKLVGVTEAMSKDVAAYKTKGTVEDIERLQTVTEAYMKHGSPKQITEMRRRLAAYEALGSIPDIRKVFKVSGTYFKMGAPKKLAAKLAEKKNEQKRNVATKIAEAFDKPVDVVMEMLKLAPAAKVIEMYGKEQASQSLTDRYRVPKTSTSESVRGKLPDNRKKSISESIYEKMH